jgi:anaerobic magnesium-protoporphyrin IX monomethyl ester cyclase
MGNSVSSSLSAGSAATADAPASLRVALIQDTGMNESGALLVLSAVVRAQGHHTRLFIDRDEPDLLSALRGFAPDVLILPIDIGGHRWGCEMAAHLAREFAVPLVVVGSWPTLRLEQALSRDEIRWVIPGECDVSLPALLDMLASGRRDLRSLPGLCWRDEAGNVHRNAPAPYVRDLDTLPPPDSSLYEPYPYLQHFGVRRFVSGRGCPNRCTYCYNNGLAASTRHLGAYVRRKSAAAFVREIADTTKRYPTHHVHMGDDLFTASLPWLREFAPAYRRAVGIPFTCNATPQSLSSEVVSLLKEAGCHGVAVGIESGDEALRRRILDRDIPDEQIRTACARVREAGIVLATFNMIAMPGETMEQALSTIRLNRDIGAQVPRLTFNFPLRGTRLTERAVTEGHLTPADLDRFEQEVADGTFRPRPVYRSPDSARLGRLFYLFQAAVLAGIDEAWLRRLIAAPLQTRALLPLTLVLEKRFFRIRWVPGLRMFLHAGHPMARTKNFNNFIP